LQEKGQKCLQQEAEKDVKHREKEEAELRKQLKRKLKGNNGGERRKKLN